MSKLTVLFAKILNDGELTRVEALELGREVNQNLGEMDAYHPKNTNNLSPPAFLFQRKATEADAIVRETNQLLKSQRSNYRLVGSEFTRYNKVSWNLTEGRLGHNAFSVLFDLEKTTPCGPKAVQVLVTFPPGGTSLFEFFPGDQGQGKDEDCHVASQSFIHSFMLSSTHFIWWLA